MAALGKPVVVDEVRVCLLRPALRGLVELIGEDAHGNRQGDAIDTEEGGLVLRVEASRGDRRVGQPEERDVVQDVVPGEAFGVPGEGPGDQGQAGLVVVEQEGRQSDGESTSPVSVCGRDAIM